MKLRQIRKTRSKGIPRKTIRKAVQKAMREEVKKEQTWWALKHEFGFVLDEFDRPELRNTKKAINTVRQFYLDEFGLVVIPVKVKLVEVTP